MALHRKRKWFALALSLLLILSLLMIPLAAALHEDSSCAHEYCPLCAFLRREGGAAQSAVMTAVLNCISLWLLMSTFINTPILSTPVLLKVRLDR